MDTNEHGSGELTNVALLSLGLEEADQETFFNICVYLWWKIAPAGPLR